MGLLAWLGAAAAVPRVYDHLVKREPAQGSPAVPPRRAFFGAVAVSVGLGALVSACGKVDDPDPTAQREPLVLVPQVTSDWSGKEGIYATSGNVLTVEGGKKVPDADHFRVASFNPAGYSKLVVKVKSMEGSADIWGGKFFGISFNGQHSLKPEGLWSESDGLISHCCRKMSTLGLGGDDTPMEGDVMVFDLSSLAGKGAGSIDMKVFLRKGVKYSLEFFLQKNS
ncbi:MAG: hypothetical protein NT099_03145 [Candidatus Saganbacteria bacterium]|nr:hypothetical protein [Candidatus Saganbacteria bacterium]